MMLFFFILVLLIGGFVIYGLIFLIMKPFKKKEDPTLELRRERFAKGEITEEEFNQKSAFLQK
ncbi:SHOCT domain-containing protein [Staphylococcus aureus]|uniref:SHOCT domain-containing protein n=1 Tax=Staphylococcus aureus TaxID=1280 RepID=UPI00190C34A3|nr:SHOCT domain-containing protein [Staphylococcus aureus]MBK4072917.1 SHOCT domain-containing protein [Staphylococcus aureus]